MAAALDQLSERKLDGRETGGGIVVAAKGSARQDQGFTLDRYNGWQLIISVSNLHSIRKIERTGCYTHDRCRRRW